MVRFDSVVFYFVFFGFIALGCGLYRGGTFFFDSRELISKNRRNDGVRKLFVGNYYGNN